MPINWGELNAVTNRYLIPELQDAVYKSGPLFLHLYQRGNIRPDGGTHIEVPVLYTKRYAQAYQRYETLDTTPYEIVQNAKFDWKSYQKPVVVDGMTQIVNAGQSSLINIINVKMQEAELSFRETFSVDMFAATQDPKKIETLQIAVSATGTYGEIDRTSNDWWRAQENLNVNQYVSRSLIQDMYGRCTFGATAPDLIITTQKIWDQIWELTASNQRFGEGDEFTIGAPFIRWNRARIMVDQFCPSGHIYFLNTDFIYLFVHPERNFSSTGWMQAINQDAMVLRLFWVGNLVVANPRFHGRITGVLES
jgi:hypothetical protein